MTKPNKQAAEFLVRSLAALEAPWAPLRSMDWPAASAICEARRQPSPATLEGGGARLWKRNQRLRDQLAAEGLTVGSVLSVAGKRLTRGWCWALGNVIAEDAVRRIDSCRQARHCLPGGFVPETLVAGEAWGGEHLEIAGLQALMIPLLCEGIVEARSTMDGQAYYRLADTAADALAAIKGLGDASTWRRDMADLYHVHRRTVREQLRRDLDYRQELGELPLPATEPLQSRRTYDNLKGFPPLFAVDAA